MTENRTKHYLRIVDHAMRSAMPMPNGKYPLALCVTHVVHAGRLFRQGLRRSLLSRAVPPDVQDLDRLYHQAREQSDRRDAAAGLQHFAELACVSACEAILSLRRAMTETTDLGHYLQVFRAVDAAARARLYHLQAQGPEHLGLHAHSVLMTMKAELTAKD